MGEALPWLMFATLLVALASGYPVAFVIPGVALLFAGLGATLDLFFLSDLGFLPARVFGVMQNVTLQAVPLFVFMGVVLEKSRLAADLLEAATRAVQGDGRATLLVVVGVGALLAASTGIVGATVVTMGLLALPTLLRQGHSASIAAGTVAASGTLGQIVPPSIVLILLGDMMSVDVGRLFVAAALPSVLLIGAYAGYVGLCGSRGRRDTREATRHVEEGARPLWGELLIAVLPPVTLIVVVLGAILGGIASPTEAAACGAVGAPIMAGLRGRLSTRLIWEAAQATVRMTAMVFTILIGAQVFGIVFRGLYGEEVIIGAVESVAMGSYGTLAVIMLIVFILGFFLDFLEICFIVIPIIMPVLRLLDFDLAWVALLLALNLQTSFLTPPFGFALFYLRGVAPVGVPTVAIYRGAVPFIGLQLAVLALVAAFPGLATWLPSLLLD